MENERTCPTYSFLWQLTLQQSHSSKSRGLGTSQMWIENETHPLPRCVFLVKLLKTVSIKLIWPLTHMPALCAHMQWTLCLPPGSPVMPALSLLLLRHIPFPKEPTPKGSWPDKPALSSQLRTTLQNHVNSRVSWGSAWASTEITSKFNQPPCTGWLLGIP